MNSTIPSNLIEQLFELSDLNSYIQFFALHKNWILFIHPFLFVLFFLCFIIAPLNRIIGKLILIGTLSLLAIVTFSLLVASTKADKATLNNRQIALLKSIDINEFQTIVQASIRLDGANMKAISTAVSKYQKLYEDPKEIERDENGRKGLELYNSIDAK